MHPPMRKEQSCSAVGADDNSEIKARQLQHYLHRSGHIPAAPHPFVKQAAKQAASHRSQLRRLLSRDSESVGGEITLFWEAVQPTT